MSLCYQISDRFPKIRNVDKYLLHFKKRKGNRLLDGSNFSEDFFKRKLKQYYSRPKEIKEIFLSKKIFAFSLTNNEKKKIIETINNLFPKFKHQIITEANSILQNQFNVYEKNVIFNKAINWNSSFFNNKSWPTHHLKNFEVNPKNRVGDIRYNWEFNSHFFLLPLGLAYYFTSDEKYSKKLISLILDWVKKNPVNFNSSWKSPLIVAYRLISWIFSLSFIKNSEELIDDIYYKIFKSMFQQAFFIFTNIGKFSYNHVIGELFSIFLFSYIYQDLKIVKKWYKYSAKMFKMQITRQTFRDGVNIERSSNYHRIVLVFFSLFLILQPDLLSNHERGLINKMYTFLANILKPNGSITLIGDSDDANIIPKSFYYNNKNHYSIKELLSLGSVLFDRRDLKYICKEISPIVILLLGIEGYSKFDEIIPSKPLKKFHFFKNSGLFVARNSYDNDSNFFFFNMADFLPSCGSHDHLDISNIIYSFRSNPVLIDSGSYRYNDAIEIRNEFRGFKAHNVLEIVNRNIIFGLKPFCWNRIPCVKYKCIDIKDNYIFEVQHNSFSNFITSRKIVISKNLETIEILDRINPQNQFKKKIKIRLYFHFHKDTIIDLIDRELIINNELKFSFKENQHLDFKINKESSYFSPSYGVKILIPLIIVEFFYEFKAMEYLEIKTQLFNIN